MKVTLENSVHKPFDVFEHDWIAWLKVEEGSTVFHVRLQIGYQATQKQVERFLRRVVDIKSPTNTISEAGKRKP